MKRLAITICLVGLVTYGWAAAPAVPAPPLASLLPSEFSGWTAKGEMQKSSDAAVADPANAEALKEYGFRDFASATYLRDDGRTLTLRAARFADASGAYGAFTFYKTPVMLNEKIGDQGASLNQRVLFYRGNVLVDAVFDKLSAMSAAELRDVAAQLPQAVGAANNLPALPTYLPKPKYIKNTAKYVMGPSALQHVGAPLPAARVDFAAGAEVVLAKYESNAGEADLMLISYPTPQIAAEKLKGLDQIRAQIEQKSGDQAIVDIAPFFAKRTGPVVAIAAGPLSQGEAKTLLNAVNYEAQVTWNENTFLGPKDNVGSLLVNVFILCGILMALTLVAGVAFGGVRIVIQRLFPGRVFDRPEQVEFISLHLGGDGQEPPIRP